MNTDAPLYEFTSAVVRARKEYGTWADNQVERYVTDNFYAWSKGEVLIATTNSEAGASYSLPYLPWKSGTTVVDLITGETGVVTDDGIPVNLGPYEVAVLVPADGQNRSIAD